MKITINIHLLLAASLFPGAGLADINGYSFTGVFANDNSVQQFNLVVGSNSIVTVKTLSYGGGVNQGGTTIAAGGFAPELTIFDSTGNEYAFDAGGSAPACNGRAVDPVTGFCLDAIIYDSGRSALTLAAGDWTVVLTQQGNDPVGELSDGFSEDAANGNDPSFTGTNAGMPGAKFLDPFDGLQRTDQWAVDFLGNGITQVSETPEPSLLLPAMALLGLIAAGRSRWPGNRAADS